MAFFEMAKTAINSLISRPATLMYPARAAKKTSISRGHVVFDGSLCISCGLCMRKCPAGAICVAKEEKTWTIDRLRCVVCNSCVEACPVSCLSMDTGYSPALNLPDGQETFPITYIKPERQKKTETAQE
jgi:formate hydrogenlyase subunit 6/NADH:ubiquinone oxidoreductase subunit I